MRALVTLLKKDNTREKLLTYDWPEPANPKPTEVKTQTLFTGVTNGTERNHLVGGNYARSQEELHIGPGYQNIGQIIEVGSDVRNLKVGDLLYMSQDHLEYCLENTDGLHLKLPSEVDLKQAALFGVSSVAMRCCRNADLRMGKRCLIVGAGLVGQMVAQIANVMGACVTICDINQDRLEIARQIGAAEQAVDVSGDSWDRNIKEATYQVVIDVAGVVGMEDKLIRATARRGTVLFIAGRFKVEYNFNLGQGRDITIKQNGHFDNDDIANLCRLVTRGLVQINPLIQDVLPINQADQFYRTLRDSPAELFGTVFDWRE